ncbi:MAG TPA: Flp pilus assembly protein CpaB [Bryobacteraceae bacterium]|jgi:pilus assembly protein CpaB|nr:Flp pilus assembly protein CpaB [Bryobacteraceae bacterium]
MNRRLASVFVFAILVATVASFLLYRLLVGHLSGRQRPQQPNVSFVVATHDLPIGTLIQKDDVRVVTTGEGALPAGVITALQDAIGRGVIAQVYSGEPLVEPRLAAAGGGAGLAGTIPVGMRAVALRVDQVIGVAGFVVPGMRVDVLIAGNDSGGRPQDTLSRTILQNIEVLSAGQKTEHTPDGKPSDAQVVNLLVKPDEAEILSLAATEAKVQLVLRNPLDTQRTVTPGTSLGQLLEPNTPGISPVRRFSAPTKFPAPKLRTTVVEVYHGGKKTEETFMAASVAGGS